MNLLVFLSSVFIGADRFILSSSDRPLFLYRSDSLFVPIGLCFVPIGFVGFPIGIMDENQTLKTLCYVSIGAAALGLVVALLGKR